MLPTVALPASSAVDLPARSTMSTGKEIRRPEKESATTAPPSPQHGAATSASRSVGDAIGGFRTNAPPFATKSEMALESIESILVPTTGCVNKSSLLLHAVNSRSTAIFEIARPTTEGDESNGQDARVIPEPSSGVPSDFHEPGRSPLRRCSRSPCCRRRRWCACSDDGRELSPDVNGPSGVSLASKNERNSMLGLEDDNRPPCAPTPDKVLL